MDKHDQNLDLDHSKNGYLSFNIDDLNFKKTISNGLFDSKIIKDK